MGIAVELMDLVPRLRLGTLLIDAELRSASKLLKKVTGIFGKE